MPGWARYEELKKINLESRTAFMAMKFGDDELNRVVADCFKPAVRRTGFELRLLVDAQPAGLIDNQMRAAILSARFVIADLSHGSHGAYWEAGFAEGRGLPVIYTCRRARWDETKTHFDTNHLLTILWDVNNLQQAEREMVATIRATLREHAKQSDD
jgi:nucleoside 2-deoxyribosyltransferase